MDNRQWSAAKHGNWSSANTRRLFVDLNFEVLAGFDGVKFTVFDKGNTKRILNNRFSEIFVDKVGVIWVATENGVITANQNCVF